MDSIKFIYNKSSYDYKGATSVKICILGLFLDSDVRFDSKFFKSWVLDDSMGMHLECNTTILEKEGDFIYLSDLYPQEKNPTKLKMTRYQLSDLLDEWQEKVCVPQPQEVIIKYDNVTFWIETSN